MSLCTAPTLLLMVIADRVSRNSFHHSIARPIAAQLAHYAYANTTIRVLILYAPYIFRFPTSRIYIPTAYKAEAPCRRQLDPVALIQVSLTVMISISSLVMTA